MPAFITHILAGQCMVNKQPPEIKNIIRSCEKIFNMGTQGPDIYFYYPWRYLKKSTRGLPSFMHKSDLGLFLLDMAKQIKISKDKILYSYTAGFLMHYCLDMYAHPFIHALTYNENDASLNNSSNHHLFEIAIDIKILKKLTGLKPADLSLWGLINTSKSHRKTASLGVNRAIKHVYNKNIKETEAAMIYFTLGTMLLQSDTGFLKRILEKLESLFIDVQFFSCMIHPQYVDNKDYFNTKKKGWSPPWDRGQIRNESFVELFNKAVDDAAKMTYALFMYVNNKIPLSELKKTIGNNSLATGLDSSIDLW